MDSDLRMTKVILLARRVGEQRGLLLRLAGDGFKLRVVVPQRLGDFHLRVGKQADEIVAAIETGLTEVR